MATRKSPPRPRAHLPTASKSSSKIAKPWSIKHSRGLQIVQVAPFSKLPWLVHGFSTRPGGASLLNGAKVLNLGFMDWDQRETVLKNRQRFASALRAEEFAMAPVRQIHSDLVHEFSGPPAQPCAGDASLTQHPGLLLAIQTADCVPILLVDRKKRAVAAIHAGWRGTLARIAQKTVGRMRMEFGSKPSEILAAIGPAIGPCCYEVAADFVTKFTAKFADAAEYFDEPLSGEEPNPLQWLNMKPPGHQPPPKNVHLDLPKANRSQLLAAGLHARNIYSANLCTACNLDLFFSYRKEGPATGRLISVTGIRPAV